MKSAAILLAAGTLLAMGAGLTSCASPGVSSDDLAAATDAPTAMGVVESRAYANATAPGGETLARAILAWDGDQIEVTAQLEGLPVGTYAVHIHETGDCSAPDYTSAGGHWNPTNEGHGFSDIEDGFHKGDLRNVEIGLEGSGTSTTIISGVAWSGAPGALFDADGAALIVHQRADDYRTDPAGDAGPRLACGIIRRG
ncbi:MAG: superoxide dismutase family protein [Pacificimonas sp.]|jgi:Cu-Zn family superoxide dismutase|nr:superoxide dismutase family protein [Pacificimonas sp.]